MVGKSNGAQNCAKVMAILILLFLIAACASARPGAGAIERRFDQLSGILNTQGEMPDRRFSSIIEKQYVENFSGITNTHYSDRLNSDSLGLLFRAAHMAAFYSRKEKYVEDMSRVLDRLIAKGAASDVHFSQLFEAHVLTRSFDRAAEVYARHPTPAMEQLPLLVLGDIPPDTGPTELVVSKADREITRRIVTLPQGPHIIVVSHPLCHFSQNATAAIDKDVELAAVFRENAKWLAPVNGRLDVDLLQAWNKLHADAPITVAYRAEEWPLIDNWATPTFYFFRDGRLKSKVSGWPAEGRHQQLRDAARGVGLLPAAASVPAE